MLNTLFPELPASKRKKTVPTRMVGRDPFHLDGPAIIKFSGGRTSGLMLWEYMQRGLGPDTHIVFCNTGKEKEETLEFVFAVEQHWAVKVHWLEFTLRLEGYDAEKRKDILRPDWREVSFGTARRLGEPFEDLARWKGAIPNRTMRFCTEYLKLWCAEQFMRGLGYDHWTSAVGIRSDEPRRVAKLRGRKPQAHEDLALPLWDAGIDEATVLDFWGRQLFDLALAPGEGNCDLCFLKGAGLRLKEMRRNPEGADWWLSMERSANAAWINPLGGRPSYQTLHQLAMTQEKIEFPTDELDPGFDCLCGD